MDPTPTEAFLSAIWGAGPHSVCWFEPTHGFSFHIVANPGEITKRMSEWQGVDVWIGAHPLIGPPTHGRGNRDDVLEVVALSADLDWAHETRRTEEKLPTEAEVRDGLAKLGQDLQPSILVHSGHGLQPWWLLTNPVGLDVGEQLIDQLGAALAKVGLTNGREDLASILRLPGTRNHKGGWPTDVTIEVMDLGRRFVPEWLHKHLPQPVGTGRRGSTGTRHRLGAVTSQQQALANFVVTAHGGHSPDIWRDGSIHLVRPGKLAKDGSSASIIVGEDGDALLTVFSDHWPGLPPGSYVLGIDGKLHHPGDPTAFFSINVSQLEAPEASQLADEDLDTFNPIDLMPYLNGTVIRVTANLATMSDGRSLLHAARLNGIHGDSGSGKSFFVAFVVQEQLQAGKPIMVIDLEDTPDPMIERLRQIGTPDSMIGRLLIFASPQIPFTPAGVARLIEHAAKHRVAHVFLETMGEAFSLEGLNEDKDVEVAPWLRRVCRHFIEQTGIGMTLIDHGTKSAERPLDPSGSKRKRAAITGTAWLMQAVSPFNRTEGGLSILTCAKDRHGWFKRGDQVARLIMDPFNPITGQTALRLEPTPIALPGGPSTDPLTQAAVDAVTNANPKPLSTNEARAEMRHAGFQGSDDRLRRALDDAVAGGAIERFDGPNRSHMYRLRPTP